MSYRRNGKEEYNKSCEWDAWLSKYRAAILETGIPSHVIRDEDHWWDFLHHGYLDHHDDPTGFSIDQLSPAQAKQAAELIEKIIPKEEWQSAIALLELQAMANKTTT